MKKYWIFQLIGWVGMFLIEMVNYGLNVQWNYNWTFMAYFTAYPIYGFLTSHLLKTILLKNNTFNLSFAKIIIIGFVSLGAWTLLMAFLVQTPEFFFDRELFYKTNTLINFTVNVINLFRYTIVWITIYFFYKVLIKANNLEIEKTELQKDKTEAELNLLKSQLNPHFLFNALNSVKALVVLDPQVARDAIVKLSEILRFSLSISNRDSITIKEELEMVENYLIVEKLRFGNRFNYQIDCNTKIIEQKIPVGVLLTLAENSIKHGISQLAGETELNISIEQKNSELFMEIKNTGKIQNDKDKKGLGLQFVEKRIMKYFRAVEMHFFESNNFVYTQIIVKKP
jgi:two-component system LytT family sensor kinase